MAPRIHSIPTFILGFVRIVFIVVLNIFGNLGYHGMKIAVFMPSVRVKAELGSPSLAVACGDKGRA